MKDVTMLHPELQKKFAELVKLCAKKGITIKATECVRTKEEQDALYAKGRTAPGAIVTNCKGSSYSSMHQWRIAVDFGIYCDTDGDGDTDIKDIYNTKVMKVVGELAKSIGLEWGGSWKSFKDYPHLQLPYWGSTATKLKALYGTPDKFVASWNSDASTSAYNVKFSNSYKKKYKTTANLRMRTSPDTSNAKNIICTIPKGKTVTATGKYVIVKNSKWLEVKYGTKTGYCCQTYLK